MPGPTDRDYGPCRVEECSRCANYKAAQLCNMHYERRRRRGTTDDFYAYLEADRPPSIAEIGWVAGFLEGDGWFGHNYSDSSPTEVVNASQKDKGPLERLTELVGGSIRKDSYDDEHHHGDYWKWTATGARARGVMLTIYALLSERRRKQIDAAMEVCR